MDIAALATVQQMHAVRGEVAIAMASEVKDMVEQSGASLIKMMEQSATPHLGANVDIKL